MSTGARLVFTSVRISPDRFAIVGYVTLYSHQSALFALLGIPTVSSSNTAAFSATAGAEPPVENIDERLRAPSPNRPAANTAGKRHPARLSGPSILIARRPG